MEEIKKNLGDQCGELGIMCCNKRDQIILLYVLLHCSVQFIVQNIEWKLEFWATS